MTKFVNKSRFVSFQAKKVITQIERKKKNPSNQILNPSSILGLNQGTPHKCTTTLQNFKNPKSKFKRKVKKKKTNRHSHTSLSHTQTQTQTPNANANANKNTNTNTNTQSTFLLLRTLRPPLPHTNKPQRFSSSSHMSLL